MFRGTNSAECTKMGLLNFQDVNRIPVVTDEKETGPWKEFRALGYRNPGDPCMSIAMTSLVAYETARPICVSLPYWRNPDMRHLIDDAEELHIHNPPNRAAFRAW